MEKGRITNKLHDNMISNEVHFFHEKNITIKQEKTTESKNLDDWQGAYDTRRVFACTQFEDGWFKGEDKRQGQVVSDKIAQLVQVWLSTLDTGLQQYLKI